MSWGRSNEPFSPFPPENVALSVPEEIDAHNIKLRRLPTIEQNKENGQRSADQPNSYIAEVNDWTVYINCNTLWCSSTIPLHGQSIYLMFSPALKDWGKVFACAYHLDDALRASVSSAPVDASGVLRDPGQC
jgi:hypothetical protein